MHFYFEKVSNKNICLILYFVHTNVKINNKIKLDFIY